MKIRIKKNIIDDILNEFLKTTSDSDARDSALQLKMGIRQCRLDFTFNPIDAHPSILDFMLSDLISPRLTQTQYRELLRFTQSETIQEILDAELPTNLRTLFAKLEILNRDTGLYCKLLKRAYPVKLEIKYQTGYGRGCITISGSFLLYPDTNVSLFSETIYADSLKLGESDEGRMNIGSFLALLGLESIPDFGLEDQAQALELASTYYKRGTMLTITGFGFAQKNTGYHITWEETNLEGYTFIAEPNLEWEDQSRYNTSAGSPCTLVRGFCLELKRYCLVDSRDLIVRVWDEHLIDHLILPPTIKSMVTKLFTVKQEDLIKDIIKTKSQNLIIMASGNPGTGKTLTGEVYSHLQHRPLYVLEVAEIGSSLDKIETNLKTVFSRISAWDCILLFDEADIFFQHRDTNLERSVIVGIFLRMLEQFKGILFITTNRPEVIDPAFYSRVTVHFKYPNLSKVTRTQIWVDKLASANLTVTDPENLVKLAEHNLNGREIHNKVKILKILYDGKPTSVATLEETLLLTL